MIALYSHCRQETIDKVESADHLYALGGSFLSLAPSIDYLARFTWGTMEIFLLKIGC